LVHQLSADPRAARAALRNGRDALTWAPGDRTTPIRRWVSWTFDPTGQFISAEDDMAVDVPSLFQGTLLDAPTLTGRSGLISARRVSPY